LPSTLVSRHASVPYVAPFAAFLACLALQTWLPAPDVISYPLQVVTLAAILYACSWEVIDLHASRLIPSALIGIAVFLIWIGPDVLFPQYRAHWFLQNSLMGHTQSSLTKGGQMTILVLAGRSVRAVLLVPLIEELFWRGWLMRWLISPAFEKVPLGTYSAQSFWITAVLFASEHGPYWDVGLVTGIIYNVWMLKTKRLGDCVLAHAVTNACLAGYVLATHKWEYWL
jgi:CAAX prenyl protease-like protein